MRQVAAAREMARTASARSSVPGWASATRLTAPAARVLGGGENAEAPQIVSGRLAKVHPLEGRGEADQETGDVDELGGDIGIEATIDVSADDCRKAVEGVVPLGAV